MRTILLLPTIFLSVLFSLFVGATPHDDEVKRMQQQLNNETMAQPFLAEEPEKVDAYIKDAMKKNLKPPEYAGPNWRAGYTCHDMLRYSWLEYRNCMYYHRYYGYYYPYR